jgi:hypothetical protein
MTVPNVTYSVLNGKLGVRAPGGVELHAYVGPCGGGAIATPTRHARSTDVLTTYVSGPAPELAMRAIENYGCEVVMCRTTDATTGSFGAIDVTGVTGTSVASFDATTHPDDDYEIYVIVKNGGTVGTLGITYQWSLDNGRTLSVVTALGTANNIVIPNSGGAKIALAAGTLLTGDVIKGRTVAPAWDTTGLQAALNAVKASLHPWVAIWVAGPVNATAATVIQTFQNGIETATGKSCKVYTHVRTPNVAESEAAYLTAQSTDYATFTEKRQTVAAGAARVVSARTGRPFVFRRPVLFAISGLPQSLPYGIDMSQTVDATPGGLPGVAIYDSNGNNVEHDEMLNPGLDDARFLTLRSWPGKQGVYVNNPRTMEGAGLDFYLDQHARILCEFCNVARATLVDELSRDLDLNLADNGPNKKGAPTERECQRIDSRVKQALLASKLAGQVTDVSFKMNRDDVVLSTQTLNAAGGIVFKGYPKLIKFTVSSINPAAI